MNETCRTLSRREALHYLGAMGITGPLALEVLAQTRREVTPAVLKNATTIIDQDFPEESLARVAHELQKELDQFQPIRDLHLDDAIEPAPIFSARGGMPT